MHEDKGSYMRRLSGFSARLPHIRETVSRLLRTALPCRDPPGSKTRKGVVFGYTSQNRLRLERKSPPSLAGHQGSNITRSYGHRGRNVSEVFELGPAHQSSTVVAPQGPTQAVHRRTRSAACTSIITSDHLQASGYIAREFLPREAPKPNSKKGEGLH